MPFVSGVPQQLNGVWVGLTDFSEFTPGAATPDPPAGMTRYGDAANDPTLWQIKNDPVEGNYLEMTGHQAAPSIWGAGIDSFVGILSTPRIEVLARVWSPTPITGNRGSVGAAIWMDGDGGNIRYFGGKVHNTSNQMNFRQAGGAIGGLVVGGAAPDAEQAGQWMWIRWQYQQFAANFNDIRRMKRWYGNLGDEPAGWQAENLTGNDPAPTIGGPTGSIGVCALGSNANQGAQRIAFISFAEDPDVNGVPGPSDLLTPGDIFPPELTIDPIQDRWVGMSGTPYEEVP